MSYCRWSSDDFKCDIYCYKDVSGGFTTHVAGTKIVGEIPSTAEVWAAAIRAKTEPDKLQAFEKWAKIHNEQMEILRTIKRVPIGLPHDGESFNDPDLESFRARLRMLKDLGYNVPDYVFEMMDSEIAEEYQS